MSRVKRSLEDLHASHKARELGRVVLGLLGRRSTASVCLGSCARAVMTSDVVTCRANDTLHRAAQIMWERDCGAVPVVEPSGRAVGVVTDRDVTMGAYTQGLPLVAIPVGRVISSVVHSVQPGATMDEVVAVMRGRCVRRVIVVGEGQRVVGIVALADVARYVSGLGSGRNDAALVMADLVATLSARRQGLGAAHVAG